MLCFPIPETEELLYSVIARAGIVAGEIDHKPLLDLVFGHRNVVATIDLPSNVEAVANNYHDSCNLTSNTLIYKHTLFPLFAPFIENPTRTKVIEWMKYSGKGSAHTATGRCASNVKAKAELLVCPACLREQIQTNGTLYVKRSWLAPSVNFCVKHGELVKTGIEVGKSDRHAFKPLPMELARNVSQENTPSIRDIIVIEKVEELLSLPEESSPTFNQWSCFYKELGVRYGTTRGQQVDHSIIKEKVLTHWSACFLQERGLLKSNNDTSWLTNMFRKHRKSFSFLQHLVSLDALEPGWTWSKVLKKVKTYPEQADKEAKQVEVQKVDLKRRKLWQQAIAKYGITGAKNHGFYGIKTWLYRHDRDWYDRTNQPFLLPRARSNNRVNWLERDEELCRKLETRLAEYNLQFLGQRLTSSWMMNLLDCKPMIEKNFAKLPRLNTLLQKYAETVSDYQIRRVDNVVESLIKSGKSLAEWKLLRYGCLSKERVKPETVQHIFNILVQAYRQSTIKHCHSIGEIESSK